MKNEIISKPYVGRLEDLPYYTSPPLQFVHRQQAALNAGIYPFTLGAKAVTANPEQVTDSTLLFIRNMSFYADVPEQDYQTGLKLAAGNTDIPALSLYFEGNAGVPILRTPIELGKYFREQDYRLLVEPKVNPNNLLGAIEGTIQQHAGLAGFAEINITVEVYVQEIVDDAFIAALKRKYPEISEGGLHL